MLKRLVVTDFAIIENIDIEFKDGLTILSGETGAGKSLIIDSLSLLLGERAQLELIRTGFRKAEITGYFEIDNIYLKSMLSKMGVTMIGSELVVKRTISTSKSTIKINDVNITLNDLKKIAKYLADIHMQFDLQKILNPDNYLEIIDGFKQGGIQEYLGRYQEALNTYKESLKRYQELLKKVREIKEKRDIYEYNLKELNSLGLRLNEEEEIKEEINHLKNYDLIHGLLEELNYLSEGNLIDNLYEIKKRVEKLSSYQNEYEEVYKNLDNYYYEIESILEDLKSSYRNDSYDPSRLEELETRLYTLDNIQKKYQKDIHGLIEYSKELEELLSLDQNQDYLVSQLKDEMISNYDKVYQCGKELSLLRQEIAKLIEKDLDKNLNDLALKSQFKVVFKDVLKEDDCAGFIFKDNGIDEVDFLIETNTGEGLKPLSKVVSGGEASRIMLALKTLFVKSQKIATVVFDEIDTGVSGEIASRVASKILEISLTTQVIAITHLPQVAALSQNHLKISKEVRDGRTYTKVKELNLEEKIYEIASMISGGKVTDKQLEYAKEMVLR